MKINFPFTRLKKVKYETEQSGDISISLFEHCIVDSIVLFRSDKVSKLTFTPNIKKVLYPTEFLYGFYNNILLLPCLENRLIATIKWL